MANAVQTNAAAQKSVEKPRFFRETLGYKMLYDLKCEASPM